MIGLRRISMVLLIASAALTSSPPPLPSQEPRPPQLDPAAKKAVGGFLEKLFGEISERAQRPPADAEDKSSEQATTPDPLDERALVNREQRTQLLRAQRMLDEGQRGAGLRLLQSLLNADEDSLLLTSEGRGKEDRWRSLHAAAEDTILHGDPQTRQDYRERYARIAEDQLKEARRAGSGRALARVTRQFFATPAGAAAADEIATLMTDAGQPAEAAYWYQRLIDGGAPFTQDPLWRRKAARVLERASHPADTLSRPTSANNSQTDPNHPPTRQSPPASGTLSEWTQPFGGPAHTGRAAASNPVLMERWSQPLTDRPQNVEQISRLVEDLQDSGLACIPAAMPLAVDGKILFRNLRGLSVVDAASGQRLWESPEAVSVERLLAGESVSRPATETVNSRLRPMSSYQGNGADQHPLTNLLFRDGVYGLISSDGERVFVLEDHATLSYRPPGYYRGQSQDDDPHGRDWETNRLVAYDLQTGRRAWSVGGSEGHEPFTPQLAGTLFQGPPVVDGDELFVIGEQHGAEILVVLDRHSGQLLWSHMLSGVSAEIEYDLVRRWWPAQPAVGKGVIICPTTVGWVVAVDRHERRIRWAQRLTDRRDEQRYARQSSVAITGPLNSRWSPSAPMLVGDRVVITPAELPDAEYHTTPRVICLETLTGNPRWEREKESLLYLGGVWGDALLLVGSDRVEARSLSDGRRLWRVPLPDESGLPSGRGVITGTDYLLPLQSGELWRISLNDGSVIAKSSLPEEHLPLGNLLVYRKQLVSLTPQGVTSFEDRAAVEMLLTSAGDGVLDPRDRLRAAELQEIDGHHRSAVELLREIDPAVLDREAAAKDREMYRSALAAVIRSDPSSAADELVELEKLAETEQQVLSARRLQAAHHAARGNQLAAFNIYWTLAQTSITGNAADNGTEIQPNSDTILVEDGETSVRRDRWLAARLSETWGAMEPTERQAIDQRVTSAVDSVLQDNPDTWEWWSQVLRFHPLGRRLKERLANRAIETGRLAEAEVRLLRLLEDRSSPESRSGTLQQLVTLLDGHGRTDDAASYYAQLVEAITADEAAVGNELRRWERQRRQQSAANEIAPRGNWNSDEFSLSRTTLLFNQQSPQVSLAAVDTLPSVDGLQFLFQPGLQRLNIDTVDGQRYWATPLRSPNQQNDNQTDIAGSVGQLLFVHHRGVLHALSLPDRELLWQRPLAVRQLMSASILRSFPAPPEEMAPAGPFETRNGLTRQQADTGTLAVVRPHYLCYFGRNSITAADPLSGEMLWTRRGIRPETLVAGNNRHLYINPRTPARPFAIRADDGMQVDLPHLETTLASAIGVYDDGLVTLEDDHQQIRLALNNDETGEPAWQTTFPDGTLFTLLEADTLFAIEKDGTLRLVNWAERQDRVLGVLDPDRLQEARSIYAVADRRQIYVSLNVRPDRSYRSDIYHAMPVNGPLMTIDRTNGGLVWQESMEKQYLLLEHLQQLPVLILLARHTTVERPELNAQQVHLEMLDKWTGSHLLDKSRYVSLGSFRSVDVDLTARVIDLQGSRERLRIQPADVDPARE